MLESSDYDQQVYVYALADPAVFVRESAAIARFVYGALKTAPSAKIRIVISPDSGWFEFTATDELWIRQAPPYLPTRAEAQKAAETILTDIEKACSDANPAWPKGLKGLALLPPVVNLKLATLALVARQDGRGLDHWLYRAEPRLVLDGGGRNTVGVFGAQVEVRIGHMGRPISVRSRWTPLSGEKILTPLSRYQTPEDADGELQPPFINYLLDGDGVPQFYLAPYYFASDGHDIGVSSASPFSLTVDVARVGQTRTDLTLIALASGGSGAYLYNWATYSLLAIEDGIREIGTGDKIRIENADASRITIENVPCVMLLNVKDKSTTTGAFKHCQYQVFPSPQLVDSDRPGGVAAIG